MLNLFASLVLNLVVSAQPGNNVLPLCEWTPATVEGIESNVCDGTVVAKRDQLGNVRVYADWR